MIEELRDLNEQFYLLCSRLDKYCEKLSEEMHAYMQSVLLEQYKDEYTLLALKCGIETKREIDELEAKQARVVPHRWRFLKFLWGKKNYAAVLNDAKADEYAAREFAAIEARIMEEARARCAAGAKDGVPEGVDDEPIEEGQDGAEQPAEGNGAETDEAETAENLTENAEQTADGAGDGSDAGAPDESGATLEEIEAKLAQDAWEKLAAKAESADPKSAKSDENNDVPEIPKNRDENARSEEDPRNANP